VLAELRSPASAAEVARRLGESRQRLNYHLKQLERVGLVRRVGTRRAGGFTETLYEADAGAFVVSPAGSWPLADCEPSPDSDAEGTGDRRDPLAFKGAVTAIYLATAAEAAPAAVGEAKAMRGLGLEGDRYFERRGTYSERPGDGREVTLIELEVLDALRGDGIDLTAGEHRRNVVTCGVPLNHLVGRRFSLGGVVLAGKRLCEPCAHLARITRPEVLPALVHRGGLRADILRGGTLRAGDDVRPVRD
jgi:MOSC domain-containing protein YiiM